MFVRLALWACGLLMIWPLGGCPRPTRQDDLTTVVVAGGFEEPTYVTSALGDSGTLYVVERRTGKVRIVREDAILATPFLDVSAKLEGGGEEQGLFCIAFHPDYAENGFAYISYTASRNALVVERYTVSGSDPDRIDPETAAVILNIGKTRRTHQAGMLAFGPNDGFLYVSVGDDGSGTTIAENAQDLSTKLGKLLRIDVDSGAPFAIPADNPFVGTAGADPAIWAYGLRNPWRFSFDRANGDLYLGDVGHLSREEIDYQPASSPGGENYGWNVAEGFACVLGVGSCGTDAGFTPPIHDYAHALLEGAAIAGGYVYRGTALPEAFRGAYFFSDYPSGASWYLRHDGSAATEVVEITNGLSPDESPIGPVSSWGQDADGELYLCDIGNGRVLKLVENDALRAK